MKLSILVPVYNEEKTIAQVVEALIKLILPCQKEIIIINDGSTDDTAKILRAVKKKYGQKAISVIHHSTNKGKGKAIDSGIRAAKGQYILIQDADLEYDPLEIPRLLEPIIHKSNKHGYTRLAVYGSRFLKKNYVIPLLYYWGNRFLTTLLNFLYGVRLTDMETGYKLFPKSLLENVKIHANHFNIEPEITVQLIKKNIPIVEVPINYKGRSRLAGKKLTVIDAIEAIKTLFYFKLKR